MPIFIYRAAGTDGRIHKSTIEKQSAEAAEEYIRSLKLVPIEIKKQNFFNMDISDSRLFAKRMQKRELAFLCRKMAFLLNSGITIGTAVSILAEQGSSLRSIIMEAGNDIQKGTSLSDSFSKHGVFPTFFIHMLRVGEQSGRLPHVIDWLADYYEKEHIINENVKSAMVYPAVVSLMMLSVIMVSIIYVVPNYAGMFASSGMELPLPTQLLIKFSGFLSSNFQAIAIGIVSFILLIYFFLTRSAGAILVDRLKLFSKTYLKIQNSRFSKALSILLESNQDLAASMEITGDIMNNRILNQSMLYARLEMRSGVTLSNILDTMPYMDELLVGMLKIGEETGKTPEIMTKCASYLQGEADIMLMKLNKLIEPAITVVLGLVLAIIMLAVMLPAFYMSGSL